MSLTRLKGLSPVVVTVLLLAGISYVQCQNEIQIDLSCQEGWTLIGHGCYRLFTNLLTWASADRVCQSYGGYLATPLDFQENEDLGQFVNDQSVMKFWIGFYGANRMNASSTDRSYLYYDDMQDRTWIGRWDVNQPDFDEGACIIISSTDQADYGGQPVAGKQRWSLESCDMKEASLCQRPVCSKLNGTFHCANGRCLSPLVTCDGFDDCGDNSDEMDCSNLCHDKIQLQGIYTYTFPANASNPVTGNVNCMLLVEADVGKNIRLNITSSDLVEGSEELIILDGALTDYTSREIARFSGQVTAVQYYYSSNNMMIVQFKSSLVGNISSVEMTFEPVSVGVETTTMLIATDTIQYIDSPLYGDYELGSHDLSYVIEAESRRKNVLVEILDLDLAPESELQFRDGEDAAAMLLETLMGSNSGNGLVMSTGRDLYLNKMTKLGGPNKGVKLAYKQGCDAAINKDTGYVSTPGFELGFYPSNLNCQWDVSHPNGKPLTIVFDDLDVGSNVVEVSDETMSLLNLTGTRRPSPLTVASGKFFVKFMSGSTQQAGRGFNFTFSLECPEPDLDLSLSSISPAPTTNYGSRYTVTCVEGSEFYQEEHKGKSEVVMECGANGRWNVATSPKCTRVLCPEAPGVDNGYVESSTGGLVYQGTLTYACSFGFILTGTATVDCQADGNWTALPTCETANCPAIPEDPTNGYSIVDNSEGSSNTSYATIVRYYCDAGYQLIGNTTLFCDTDGQWVGGVPTCQALTCYISDIENGTVSQNLVNVGENVTVTCNDGYQATPGPDMTCGTDRKLSPMVSCVNINECEDNSTCSGECQDLPGSYQCICGFGTVIVGADCGISILVPDENECVTEDPCDGICNNTDDGYICSCTEGYALYEVNGTEGFYLPAGEDGTREDDLYLLNRSCVAVMCSTPSVPANSYQLDLSNSYHYNDTVEFRCRLGYQLTGSADGVITCGADGNWIGDGFICDLIMCDVEPVNTTELINPGRLSRNVSSIGFGDSIDIICNRPGLEPSPDFNRTRHCTYIDGEYRLDGSTNYYECGVIDCGDLPDEPGATYTDITGTYYLDTAVFTCVSNYTLSGSSNITDNATVTCRSSGQWDLGTLTCDGKACDDPGQIQFGVQIVSDYHDKVVFECTQEGYELQPPYALECELQSNGTVGYNVSSLPVCVDVKPPQLLSPCENGTYSLELEKYSSIGDNFPQISAEDPEGGIRQLVISPNPPSSEEYVTSLAQVAIFTYLFSDHRNNNASCVVTVSVKDTMAPRLTCPDPIEYEFRYMGEVVSVSLNRSIVSVTDDGTADDDIQVLINPSSTNFEVNNNTLLSTFPRTASLDATVRATDEAGNEATCSFDIFFKPDVCSEFYIRKPNNASMNCSSPDPGVTCNITCDDGYRIYGDIDQSSVSLSCPGPGVPFSGNTDIKCVYIDAVETEGAYRLLFNGTYTSSENISAACEQDYIDRINTALSSLNSVGFMVSGDCDRILSGAITGVGYVDSVRINTTQVIVDYRIDFNQTKDGDYELCATYTETYFVTSPPNTLRQLNPSDPSTCPTIDLVQDATTDDYDFNFYTTDYFCDGTNQEPVQYTIDDRVVGLCLKCPEGTYKAANGDCVPCAAGTFSMTEDAASCQDCPGDTSTYQAGAFTNEECTNECAAGTYNNVSGLAPCTPCPKGTYWVNAKQCEACPGDNSTKNVGASSEAECVAICPPGTFNEEDGYAPCTPCPRHMYSNESGELGCKMCNVGTATEMDGSTSEDNCTAIDNTSCKARCVNGDCQTNDHYYSCVCSTGWMGENCDLVFDPCDSFPCHNNGTCMSEGLDFNCTCVDGTYGDFCENINKTCTADTCENGGNCENLVGQAECHCLSGFTGDDCSESQDVCSDHPCVNNATCEGYGSVRFSCICQPGYTGDNCQDLQDACYTEPCWNDGTCSTDGPNSYSCDCSQTDIYSGSYCEERVERCDDAMCGGSAQCEEDYDGSSYVCVCPPGQENQGALSCPGNWTISSESSTCIRAFNDSKLNWTDARAACQGEGGDLVKIVNEAMNNLVIDLILTTSTPSVYHWIGLSDVNNESVFVWLDETTQVNYTDWETTEPNNEPESLGDCVAIDYNDDGWRDTSCISEQHYVCEITGQYTSGTPEAACVAIDYCDTSPCLNGGDCSSGTTTYSCTCPPGYEGSRCQYDIDYCIGKPCQNGGLCIDGLLDYTCNCSDTGFNGTNCETEIDECTTIANCSANSDCADRVNNFECVCDAGYTGRYCETNIDDCAPQPCLHGGECVDLIADYMCNCPTGWQGKNCEQNVTYCTDDTCKNGAECEDLFSGYFCKCEPNTFGVNCSGSVEICDVADPCIQGNCSGSSGDASCSCPTEYNGDRCEERRNPCSSEICKNGGTCVPSLDDYECMCPEGYDGDDCSNNPDDCLSAQCPAGATCIDMPGAAFCRCPLGTEGPSCSDATNSTFDLLFDSPDKTGMAAPAYPIPLSSSVLSVALWLQFAERDDTGVFLDIFTVPSPNSLLDKKLLLRLNESVLMYQDPVSDEVAYVVKPNPSRSLTDGQWHYLVITLDLQQGEVFYIADTIKSDPVDITQRNMDLNLWIVLGSMYDSESDMPVEEEGFYGKMSYVTVYNRGLDFNLVSSAGNTDVAYLFDGSILRWGLEYVLMGGVQRLTPSMADASCPIGYTGDDCTQLLPGKSLVTVESCPEDIIRYTEDRLIEIMYTEPTFQGEEGSIRYSISSDDTYTWGRYPVTIEASNTDGNSALCHFNIYVQNDQCKEPDTPPNVQELMCEPASNTNYTDYRECSITCIDGYSPSIPGPYLHTCGPTGNWDPQNMFDPYQISPCGRATAAKINLVVTIRYNVISSECDYIRETLIEKILEALVALNSQWNSICGQPDCSDTVITVICPVTSNAIRRRRQAVATTPVEVTITQPNVNSTVNNTNTGETINIETLFDDLLFSLTDNIFDYSGNLAGASPDQTDDNTLVILQLECDAPNVLLEGECVACGPGTYYNSTVMACQFCEPGSYQDQEGQLNCTMCGSASTTQYYGAYNSTDCKEICPPGQYFDTSSDGCKNCSRGFYQPQQGQFYCEPCSADKTTKFEGTVNESSCANDCPSGQEIGPNNNCVVCTIGFYRGPNDPLCMRCSEGSVTTNNGSTSEDDCNVADNPAGTYRNASNLLQAVDCPIGQYQPLKWQYECLKCDDDYTTERTRSESESDCKFFCGAGEEKVNGEDSCKLCDKGYYRDGSETFKPCDKCPSLFTTVGNGSISELNCTVFSCPAGQQPNNTNTGCEFCPLGYYQPLSGQEKCEVCQDGKSTRDIGSESSSDCETYCPPGQEKSDNGSCIACPLGSYKSNMVDLFAMCTECSGNYVTESIGSISADNCTVLNCLEGNRANYATEVCEACPLGTYQDQKYQDKCISCIGMNSTREVNSTSADDCEFFCDPGYEKDGDGCSACERGYYKNNDDSVFMECTACPDSNFTTDGTASTHPENCTLPNCSPGSYIDGNGCTLCTPGQWQNESLATSCNECPTDTYSPDAGADSEDLCLFYCGAGEEKKSGEDSCKLCDIGYYRNGTERFEPCVACPQFYTTAGNGSTSDLNCTIFICPPGQQPNENNTGCDVCPLGQYQSTSGQAMCEMCQDGYSTRTNGSTSNTSCEAYCPPGQEKSDNGSCLACPLGYYKNNMEDLFAMCTECSGNYVTESGGSISADNCTVLDCAEGNRANYATGVCEACPLGSYQDQKYQQRCILCTGMNSTREVNSTSADDCEFYCDPGYEKDGEACSACERGYYKNNDDSVFMECTACPDSNFTTEGTAATHPENCTLPNCSPGSYIDGIRCTLCPAGQWQNESLATSCKDCPTDTFTMDAGADSEDLCLFFCGAGEEKVSGEDSCKPCDKGYYRDGSKTFDPCDMCPSNYTTVGNGSISESNCTIFICPAGQQPNGTNNGCDLCPLGQYQPMSGQEMCETCDSGYSTRDIGSESEASCEAYCPEGQEKAANSTTCVDCPIGYYKRYVEDLFAECAKCSGNYITESTGSISADNCTVLNCSEGNQANYATGQCEACPLGTYQDQKYQESCISCIGMNSTREVNSTSADDCEFYCDPGYEKDGDGCSACERGYYKNNDDSVFMECTACPDSNFTTDGIASTHPENCSLPNCTPGSFIDGNRCTLCPVGQWQNESLATSCNDCPDKKDTADVGADTEDLCLLNCPPGEQNPAGTDFCEPCPVAYYKDAAGLEACTPCAADLDANAIRISNETGANNSANCDTLVCSPGNYTSGDQCLQCGYGTYQPEKWQVECLPCSGGTTTYSLGAVSQDDCEVDCNPGESLEGSQCQPCAIGYYNDKSDPTRKQCFECPGGNLTARMGATSVDECNITSCTVLGTYRNPATNLCEDCPVGQYQNTTLQDSCFDCPDGYTTRTTKTTSMDDCIRDCPSGQQLNDATGQCDLCPEGQYRDTSSSPGSLTCTPCTDELTTAGTGADEAADCNVPTCAAGNGYNQTERRCEQCPVNTYQNQAGQFLPCEDCPTNQITGGTGSTKSEDCYLPCSVANNCNSPSETCVDDASTNLGYRCDCSNNYIRQGSDCTFVCDVDNYCGDYGICQSSSASCLCTDGFTGSRCTIRPSASSQSDNEVETIVIAVVATVILLLIIILLVVFCFVRFRRSRTAPRKQYQDYGDQMSLNSQSVKAYDNMPVFSAVNPTYNSGPPSMFNGLNGMGQKTYALPTYNGDSGDPAFYTA